jgi:hypothetical protein
MWKQERGLLGLSSSVNVCAPPYGPVGYPLTAPIGFIHPSLICDGVFDNTAILNVAVTKGNVYLNTPGVCVVAGQVVIPSNRVLQCAPGNVLKYTLNVPRDTAMLLLNHVVNVSVLGCTLIGTNIAVPPVLIPDPWQANELIGVWGASKCLIAGNSLYWTSANSAIHVNEWIDWANPSHPAVPSTFNTFRNNYFGSAPGYGLAIIYGTDNLVSWNLFVNSGLGAEANPGQLAGTNARNWFDNNFVAQTVPSQTNVSFRACFECFCCLIELMILLF